MLMWSAILSGSIDNEVFGYLWMKPKKNSNPFFLQYLGDKEMSQLLLEILKSCHWFVAIGDNHVQHKVRITSMLEKGLHNPVFIFHKNSIISKIASVGYGTVLPQVQL